jgi:hypothetical protein
MIQDEPPVLHGILKTDRLVVFGGGITFTLTFKREQVTARYAGTGGAHAKAAPAMRAPPLVLLV